LDEYRDSIEKLCEYNVLASLNKTPERLIYSDVDEDQPNEMEDFGGGEDYLLDQQVDEPMFSAGLDLQKKENFLASQMNLDNLGLT